MYQPIYVETSVRNNQECLLLQIAQIRSGAHPASYPMGNGGSFLGDKTTGAWNWPLTFN
jgi:hypothetical protein